MKELTRTTAWTMGRIALLVLLVSAAMPQARAMPSFSRQYGLPCSACHTIIPRLSEAGYEFRRAGFRMPDQIGKEQEYDKNRDQSGFSFANYFDARIQSNLSYLRRNHASSTGGYSATGGSYTNDQIEFLEFTLYPLTGGFLKNWSTESEISGGTDEIEVENAYLRYNRGAEDFFWEARAGIFHPFEGYGASDRVLGLARPLIQSSGSVNANGDKNDWHPWGFDQAGIEWGVSAHKTSASLMVFNGLIENAEDPAQGGGLKKAAGSPTEKDKDFQIFFNQFLGKTDMAVGAFYYNGRISLNPGNDPINGPLYADKFQRYALYLTFPVNKVWFLGAYSSGSDKDDLTSSRAKNKGFFLEVDGYPSEKLGVGARYDQFDPTDLVDNNDTTALTAFVNVPWNNGLQLVGELRNKKTEHQTNPSQTENSANIRIIYIW